MIVMRFPTERVLFVVDVVSPSTVGFRDFPGGYIEDWIEYLERIEQLDFDILAPGHGRMGTKADIASFRNYMQELRAEVLGHMRNGKSIEQVTQLVTMPKYKS
jgi:glyoxylase-like metal-dependent hydrolase (beta-lactamase superfamily II)